jgi:hypothetical protein
VVSVSPVEGLKTEDSFESIESIDSETALPPVIDFELLAFSIVGVVAQLENIKIKME